MKNIKSTVFTLFFLSGIAGLVYEVVWIRMFISSFGATVYAVSTVVTAFMAGLALGSYFFGKRIDRGWNPLLFYAVLEVGIAVSALLLPLLLLFSEKLYIFVYQLFPGSFYIFNIVRFLLSFIPLLIPTTLMGATLPVLSKFVINRKEDIGSDIGTLYGLNTIGAVIGTYLAGFILISSIGLWGSISFAICLNIIVAVIAYRAYKSDRLKEVSQQKAIIPPIAATLSEEPKYFKTIIITIFFFTGFCSLAFEILWTKGLALFVDNTVYSFSSMLTTFLLGIGLGSFIWARFLDFKKHLLLSLSITEILIGLWGILTIPIFHSLAKVQLFQGLLGKMDNIIGFSIPYFGITLPLMLFPTLLMGIAFPLIIKILIDELKLIGATVGKAYAINTLGSIAGSFTAGFILLPLVGIQKSIIIVAGINITMGIVAFYYSKTFNKKPTLAITGILILLLGATQFFIKTDKPLILSTNTFVEKQYGEQNLLFYKEDPTAIVTVRKIRTGELLLEINGKSVAGTSYEYRNTQKMQGHLPILLFGKPKSVLQVGFGSGGSLWSISQHDFIEEIHCAEICKSVLDAAPFFQTQNAEVLQDPRLKVIFDDAKNYILKTKRKYDIIMSDSVHPTYAGNGSLYAVDYFEICKEHLNPGGMMSFWFPFYSLSQEDYSVIMRSFLKVFPHISLWYVNTNVNPYTIIVGSNEPFSVDFNRITKDILEDEKVKADLNYLGIDDPFSFVDCFVMAEESIGNFCKKEGILNTVNYPYIEFSTPRIQKIGREGSWHINFLDIIAARESIIPFLKNYGETEEERSRVEKKIELYAKATTHLLNGQAAQLAEKYNDSIKEYKEALNVNPDDKNAKILLEFIYRDRAEKFRKMGTNLQMVINEYKKALEVNPDSPKSNNNIGTTYLNLGEIELAKEYLEKASKLDPSYITPLLNLGYLHLNNGQPAASRKYFLKALEIDPNNKHALDALSGNTAIR
ncbi:MAG: fused MFS/spermidine synthase [bacterium]